MDNTIKYMNRFLSYIHMGSTIFRQHMKNAKDEELSDLMMDEIKKFKEHEEKTKKMIEEYGEVSNELSFMQKRAICFSSYKLKGAPDFRISLSAINSTFMGLTKSLEFLDRYKDVLPKDFLNLSLRIIDFYSTIINEHQDYLLNLLNPED